MQRLTTREEEIMRYFWEHGALFIKELLEFQTEPKPHFNTLSTFVKRLENKKFLAYRTCGNTYQYYPIITEEAYRQCTLKGVISKYFDNSYLRAVSSLVKSENITLDELKALIRDVENKHKRKVRRFKKK